MLSSGTFGGGGNSRQVEIDRRNRQRAFETAARVTQIGDRPQLDSAEIQIGRQSRDGRRRRNVGGVAAGELLQLTEPALELAVRDIEAVEIILELVELRLLRGGVGVDLALDSIELGVERKFGSIARRAQSSLDVRANLRLERRARRVGLRREVRGFGPGLFGGGARLLELIGEVARPLGGLTARPGCGAGGDLSAHLRQRELDLDGLQIFDRIGVENQLRAAAVFDRVGGSIGNYYSNHRQLFLADGLVSVAAARRLNDGQLALARECVEDRAPDLAVVFVENGHRIFPARSGPAAVNFCQREAGGGDDRDRRDQQHEHPHPVAPDEQEFLADGQPHRAQHYRLAKIIGFMARRAARGRLV